MRQPTRVPPRSIPSRLKIAGFTVIAATLSILLVRSRQSAATPSTTRKSPYEDGTRAMAALLTERAAAVNPGKLVFLVNDQRAQILERRLQTMPPSMERLQFELLYATELLQSGHIDESLKQIETLRADLIAASPDLWKEAQPRVLLLKATAYMRMAEEQNCCASGNEDSCLLPIKGHGVHTKKEGARHAVEVLQEVLKVVPDNLQARWLLNVAHMTLGSYPDGVPAKYLIPPKVFASEYPLPRFDNVAKEAGVDVFGLSGGAILDDFDNDGRLDLMVSHLGLKDQTRVFFNKGDGTFEDRTEKAGITGEVGGLNMIQADYDNDGFVDVLILRGGWMAGQGKFPMSLLHNNGNGTFSDVTVAAGLLRLAPSQTATWLDYDGDGRLDLFVGNESVPKDEKFPCQLYHNNGDGTFTEVAHEVGLDYVGFVKGVTSDDYDNDGRPDLYVSVQLGENVLFHNDGPATTADGRPTWRFHDATKAAGNPVGTGNSFGVFFFDYDNDGWNDLFVTGYSYTSSMADDVTADRLGLPTRAARDRLYHNRGDGTFEDVTKAMGLDKVVPGMGLNFGDLDNDGYLDIYQGTGNPDLSSIVGSRMFRNDGGKRFQDVTTAGNFGHLQKGHAIAFGDIDNDGDQDVFAQMGGAFLTDNAYSALYANPGNTNGWIGLELEGVKSNRKAIGARIKVTLDTPHGPRAVYRTVSSGGSFGGNPLRQEIGVGDATTVSAVEITWPVTGRTQRLSGLALGHAYRVREDDPTVAEAVRPRFSLPTAGGAPSTLRMSTS